MRKRLVSAALAAAMALSMTACTSNPAEKETEAAAPADTEAAEEGEEKEAAADGDLRSGRLFVENVQGMRGARQLYWSKGLKDLVGIDDLTDEKIAERTDDDAVILGRLSVPQWNAVLALYQRYCYAINRKRNGFHVRESQ